MTTRERELETTSPGRVEGVRRVFSGIQPSGDVQLGNYIGAIKGWVDRQEEKENYFCIVDLHALTTSRRSPTSCVTRRARWRRCCLPPDSTRRSAPSSSRAT